MYNVETLNAMKPKIIIEYRLRPGMLTTGTLDSVPEEAFGARIYQSFPVVGANGEFQINGESFELFVGKKLDVENALQIVENEETKAKLERLKAKGYKDAVIPAFTQNKLNSPEIWPVSCKDAVVSSNQELAATIAKIKATYESIDFEISVRGMDKAAIKSL